jgi:glycerol-3-phosphate O-acyltransferase / dihydroxyacetone phosphate acyltransferase
MRVLRRLLDDVLSLFARIVLHVFFRDVEVKGLENLRTVDGSLLLVANHVNNLIDPFLLLAFVGRRPRFLAKSTLWSHPVVAPLLVLMGALPVYRRQDGARVSRNMETFGRCRTLLGAFGTVALFPEGRSHNEPGPLPLKTGAARIALETAERFPEVRLRIVPVGLIYEDKERFRSRVLVHVGTPIDPSPEAARHAADKGGAVRTLTERIAAGLEAVTVRFASWEEARLVDRAVELATVTEVPLSTRRELWQRLVSGYQRLLSQDPERARDLLARLRAWDAAEQGGVLRRTRIRRTIVFLLPGSLGVVLNWLPYRLPGWLAGALTRFPDEPATYKLVSALILFPLTWATEVALAAYVGGWVWGLGMLVAAPASGYAALLLQDALGSGWSASPRAAHSSFPEEERRALREAVRKLTSGVDIERVDSRQLTVDSNG